MRTTVLTVALLASLAPASYAQSSKDSPDALNPTDILDFGEISGTLALRYELGQASVTSPILDADINMTEFQFQLEGAVGLGQGFETELQLPFQVMGGMEGDGELAGGGGSFDLEEEDGGLGDLTLIGNYRITKDASGTPHWMAGLIAVLPTGGDDIGEAELSGAITGPGEDGGIGDGVFKVGVQTGVSKDFGAAEPYALVSYLLSTGKHEDGNVEVDVADVLTFILGSRFPVAKTVTIDVRTQFDWIGEEVEEETGSADAVDEAHLELEAQVRGYVQLGQGITLVAGGGVGMAADHALDKDAGFDLEDAFGYAFEIGIHLRLGAFK